MYVCGRRCRVQLRASGMGGVLRRLTTYLEGLAQVRRVELAGADLRAVDVLLPARFEGYGYMDGY